MATDWGIVSIQKLKCSAKYKPGQVFDSTANIHRDKYPVSAPMTSLSMLAVIPRVASSGLTAPVQDPLLPRQQDGLNARWPLALDESSD